MWKRSALLVGRWRVAGWVEFVAPLPIPLPEGRGRKRPGNSRRRGTCVGVRGAHPNLRTAAGKAAGIATCAPARALDLQAREHRELEMLDAPGGSGMRFFEGVVLAE